MTVVIDPVFSVYNLTLRVQAQDTPLRHRRAMSLISYEIENASLIDGARTRVFAGFQRFSKFLPQVARYRRLAAIAESIYVFGVADTPPPAIANVTYVPLSPRDQLAKEWFLVSYGRDYASALATEETSDFDDPDEQRLFRGVWTFNPHLVSILGDWLTSAVDARPTTWTADTINRLRHTQFMLSNMARLLNRLNQMPTRDAVLRAEIEATIRTEVRPAIEQGE
jgi:DICT domain-containing protein